MALLLCCLPQGIRPKSLPLLMCIRRWLHTECTVCIVQILHVLSFSLMAPNKTCRLLWEPQMFGQWASLAGWWFGAFWDRVWWSWTEPEYGFLAHIFIIVAQHTTTSIQILQPLSLYSLQAAGVRSNVFFPHGRLEIRTENMFHTSW